VQIARIVKENEVSGFSLFNPIKGPGSPISNLAA